MLMNESFLLCFSHSLECVNTIRAENKREILESRKKTKNSSQLLTTSSSKSKINKVEQLKSIELGDDSTRLRYKRQRY